MSGAPQRDPLMTTSNVQGQPQQQQKPAEQKAKPGEAHPEAGEPYPPVHPSVEDQARAQSPHNDEEAKDPSKRLAGGGAKSSDDLLKQLVRWDGDHWVTNQHSGVVVDHLVGDVMKKPEGAKK